MVNKYELLYKRRELQGAKCADRLQPKGTRLGMKADLSFIHGRNTAGG